MAVFLALLRAVNVANTQLSMQDLRELLVGLGFTNVRSLLQSGNLVFTAAATGDTEVERRLEGELEKELGIRTDFFVRSPKEWRSLIDHNPFPDEAIKDPAHLVIMFLKDRPSAEAVRSLHDAIQGPERIPFGRAGSVRRLPERHRSIQVDRRAYRTQARNPRDRPELEHCSEDVRAHDGLTSDRRPAMRIAPGTIRGSSP